MASVVAFRALLIIVPAVSGPIVVYRRRYPLVEKALGDGVSALGTDQDIAGSIASHVRECLELSNCTEAPPFAAPLPGGARALFVARHGAVFACVPLGSEPEGSSEPGAGQRLSWTAAFRFLDDLATAASPVFNGGITNVRPGLDLATSLSLRLRVLDMFLLCSCPFGSPLDTGPSVDPAPKAAGGARIDIVIRETVHGVMYAASRPGNPDGNKNGRESDGGSADRSGGETFFTAGADGTVPWHPSGLEPPKDEHRIVGEVLVCIADLGQRASPDITVTLGGAARLGRFTLHPCAQGPDTWGEMATSLAAAAAEKEGVAPGGHDQGPAQHQTHPIITGIDAPHQGSTVKICFTPPPCDLRSLSLRLATYEVLPPAAPYSQQYQPPVRAILQFRSGPTDARALLQLKFSDDMPLQAEWMEVAMPLVNRGFITKFDHDVSPRGAGTVTVAEDGHTLVWRVGNKLPKSREATCRLHVHFDPDPNAAADAETASNRSASMIHGMHGVAQAPAGSLSLAPRTPPRTVGGRRGSELTSPMAPRTPLGLAGGGESTPGGRSQASIGGANGNNDNNYNNSNQQQQPSAIAEEAARVRSVLANGLGAPGPLPDPFLKGDNCYALLRYSFACPVPPSGATVDPRGVGVFPAGGPGGTGGGGSANPRVTASARVTSGTIVVWNSLGAFRRTAP